jgi:hypothetical protein
VFRDIWDIVRLLALAEIKFKVIWRRIGRSEACWIILEGGDVVVGRRARGCAECSTILRALPSECEISQLVSYQLKFKAQLIDLYVFDVISLAN